MQKASALIFITLFLIGFASYGLADELTLKASGEGQWAILNASGQEIGTLAKVGKGDPQAEEAGGYSILPKGGSYLGIVKSNGDLQLLSRHVTVTPGEVRLYLDVLEAMKTLK
jgi:hypothetical protein